MMIFGLFVMLAVIALPVILVIGLVVILVANRNKGK